MCSRASYYIACSCRSRLSVNDPPGLCKWSCLESSGSQPSRLLPLRWATLWCSLFFLLCVFSCSVVINSLQPVLSSLIVNKLSCNRQDLRFFLASLPRTEAHRREGSVTFLLLTHPAPTHMAGFRLLFSPRLRSLQIFISCHGCETWREKGEFLMEGDREEEISRGWGWADGPRTWHREAPSPTAAALWEWDVISDDCDWDSLSKDSYAPVRACKRQILIPESTAAVDVVNAKATCGQAV